MTRRTFRKDEVLVEQGTILGSLMVVRSGVAADIRRDQDREIETARLAPCDFFGEGGLLTSTGEPGTIRARTLVVVYEITQDGLAPLLRDRPAIAEELGCFLAKRAAAASATLVRDGAIAAIESAPTLAARIRRLFQVG